MALCRAREHEGVLRHPWLCLLLGCRGTTKCSHKTSACQYVCGDMGALPARLRCLRNAAQLPRRVEGTLDEHAGAQRQF